METELNTNSGIRITTELARMSQSCVHFFRWPCYADSVLNSYTFNTAPRQQFPCVVSAFLFFSVYEISVRYGITSLLVCMFSINVSTISMYTCTLSTVGEQYSHIQSGRTVDIGYCFCSAQRNCQHADGLRSPQNCEIEKRGAVSSQWCLLPS